MEEILRWYLSLKDEQRMYVSSYIHLPPLRQSSYHLPPQTLVDTVIFHLNARTGEDALGLSKKDPVLQGLDVIHGPLVEVYLLQTEIKMVVLLDEFLQVCVFIVASPSCSYLISGLLISRNASNSNCFQQNRSFALFPSSR